LELADSYVRAFYGWLTVLFRIGIALDRYFMAFLLPKWVLAFFCAHFIDDCLSPGLFAVKLGMRDLILEYEMGCGSAEGKSSVRPSKRSSLILILLATFTYFFCEACDVSLPPP